MSKLATVNQFAVMVASMEGKKEQIDIANIKETLKVTRILLKRAGIDIYDIIKHTPKEVLAGKAKWETYREQPEH